MIFSLDEYLEHYGTPRHSGRYPWGSGGNAQRSKDFLAYIADLKKQGLTEVEIAEGLGINTTQLRAQKSLARNEKRAADIAMAQRLKDKGLSTNEVARRMNMPEPTVRNLLKQGTKDRNDVLTATSNLLKDQVESKKYIDVSVGVEHHLGITRNKLNTAVSALEDQGYKVQYVKVPQLGTGEGTSIKVLTAPNISYSELYKNRDQIQPPFAYSEDRGRSYLMMKPPLNISSKRVAVRYAEDGGSDADGVIYVRPGVPDCSLGKNRYGQVRIAVDGTHYLKGMAVYKDDLPDGIDLMFNTNKSNTGNKLDAMKKLEADPANPFGSTISKQILGRDSSGKEQVMSVMNMVNEEGRWDQWNKSLSAQVLSKQSISLAKQQLDKTYEDRKKEFDEIKALTNPAVKKKMLESFADNTDSAAVHLKAASLPRQSTHVILPVPQMKETQIYAPNYKDGERVALIRFPHGGKFEIPELVVNNKQPDAKKLLGNAPDAVGINPKVASRLSGADFDGDTVLVIPNNTGAIKTQPALEGLKNFDPQRSYPYYDGMKVMSKLHKENMMGVVSNLITDMTIRGASPDELARAVRHSMVVIDAEKHKLNYKQSAIDNGIAALQAKYQSSGGASTLISRANSDLRVPRRKLRTPSQGGPIDPVTGEKVWVPTNESFINKQGRLVIPLTKTTRLAETKDAHTLSSGTPIEKVYAEHSNRLKAMANSARKELLATKDKPHSPSAEAVYKKEVDALTSKLRIAQRNAPLERRAQIIANAAVAARLKAHPGLDKDQIKKIKHQELLKARIRTGAKKQHIEITDSEWDAIQSGAVRKTKLNEILRHADQDRLKTLATPRKNTVISDADLTRVKAMLRAGKTQSEIATALGVGLSTLKLALNEG